MSTVALQSFRMFNLRYVLTTLASQHQDEVIHASHLAQEDFQTILKSMMQPFHDKMSATPSYQWPGRLQRQPVRLIGLQVFAGIEQKIMNIPANLRLNLETTFLSDPAPSFEAKRTEGRTP